jgi:hypothetical protein
VSWFLGFACVLLLLLLCRVRIMRGRALRENECLKVQLEQASRRLAELEAASGPGSLLQKTANALVGLGVPGLFLVAVMATTGFAGAAAITTALAALGGPAGMLGGIATLIALGLASKALAEYGFPKVAHAVVSGLIKRGESKERIRQKLDSVPRWVISGAARAAVIDALK